MKKICAITLVFVLTACFAMPTFASYYGTGGSLWSASSSDKTSYSAPGAYSSSTAYGSSYNSGYNTYSSYDYSPYSSNNIYGNNYNSYNSNNSYGSYNYSPYSSSNSYGSSNSYSINGENKPNSSDASSTAYDNSFWANFGKEEPIVQNNKTGASVTVLMYHKLSDNESEWSDFCISPSAFEEDIEKLKKHGFTFLKPEQLKEELSFDKKYVILTFDDGYESDYKLALPILEKQQVPATFFIIGGYVDTPEYMTKEQVKKLSESQYTVIGSHSMHLHRLPQPVISRNISYADFADYMVADFVSSIDFLSGITGKPITCLSYPNGLFTETIDSGIKAKFNNIVSFSSDINKVRTPLGDKEAAGRYNRHATLDVADFR